MTPQEVEIIGWLQSGKSHSKAMAMHWKMEGLIIVCYGNTYICEGPYKATA